MRSGPVVLVGNSLSLMVAGTQLARSGTHVVVLNGAKNWGGHFSTVTCKGVPFDLGMVLQEFTAYNAADGHADLHSYDPAVRNDAGRFCRVVHDFVAGYQETREIETPVMQVNGRIHDDILIANALTALPELDMATQIRTELEAGINGARSSSHPSFKQRAGTFDSLDYETASLANHGTTFHTHLIEPFCRKVLNVATSDVLARYHRVAWLPLFYPETLLSYLTGMPQRLPPTTFSYPVGGHVGDLSAKLRQEMEQSSHVTIIRERPASITTCVDGRFKVRIAEDETLWTNQLAWGNSVGELLHVLGHADRAAEYAKSSIVLVFLQVAAESMLRNFTVFSVVDPEFGIYRITNQTTCAGVASAHEHLVAELNPDHVAAGTGSLEDWGRRVAEELAGLGIVPSPDRVEIIDARQMSNALMLPCELNRHYHAAETDCALAAAPGIELSGPASGFFSSSYNDQIVQGLKLARQWVSS